MSPAFPSPPAPPLVGHIPAFRRDVLGLLVDSVRDYGDFVRFRLGPRPVHLVNHPEAIHRVLRTHAANYDKDTRTTAFLRDVTGESLLTANGEAWQRRRHLFQPAFHRRAIRGFAAIMEEEAAALAERWKGATEVPASSALMGVTFRVVARALFGSQLDDRTVASIEEPIATVLAESFARHGSLLGRKSRRFKQAMARLGSAVDEVLGRAGPGGDHPDLIQLMREDPAAGVDLRNESITFLLAGHETTANALSWLLAFLARDPGEQERCAKDPEALDRAIRETLRLAPPIWIIERHAVAADTLGGFPVPAGGSVVVCPYTVHRHPDFWDDPGTFRPDRFRSEPPPAYLPFGLGARFCIGREFALMEARIIAGTLLRHFRFSPVDPGPPVPEPAITLRVRGGLRLTLDPRP